MKLEILVGMIASGKSTYARQRADEGALVVSHDGLTEMLHARYRYEPGLRSCYRRMEESIVREILQRGRDAVVDRTHLTRESRERWTVWADTDTSAIGVEVVAVVFPIESPGEHAVRRFESDPRGRSYEEWLGVANHHYEQTIAESFAVADLMAEGFDRVEYRNGRASKEAS